MPPPIVVTTADAERLRALLDMHAWGRDSEYVELLEAELTRARIVPPADVPADVVTMNSRFRYEHRDTGERRLVTLVYPSQADLRAGKLSVLAPVGSALLGLAVGQTIECTLPRGQVRSLVVLEILYQPEAAGDFHL